MQEIDPVMTTEGARIARRMTSARIGMIFSQIMEKRSENIPPESNDKTQNKKSFYSNT